MLRRAVGFSIGVVLASILVYGFLFYVGHIDLGEAISRGFGIWFAMTVSFVWGYYVSTRDVIGDLNW